MTSLLFGLSQDSLLAAIAGRTSLMQRRADLLHDYMRGATYSRQRTIDALIAAHPDRFRTATSPDGTIEVLATRGAGEADDAFEKRLRASLARQIAHQASLRRKTFMPRALLQARQSPDVMATHAAAVSAAADYRAALNAQAEAERVVVQAREDDAERVGLNDLIARQRRLFAELAARQRVYAQAASPLALAKSLGLPPLDTTTSDLDAALAEITARITAAQAAVHANPSAKRRGAELAAASAIAATGRALLRLNRANALHQRTLLAAAVDLADGVVAIAGLGL